MTKVVVRAATATDDAFVAASFRNMWRDIGIADADIVDDPEGRILAFLERGRAEAELTGAIAELDGIAIGCAVAQRFAGLYPDILRPQLRKYGYVWGVYVQPTHRRGGLGRRLTQACVDALKARGCTHVLLHAAPMGKGVYERMGFAPSNEMKLPLSL